MKEAICWREGEKGPTVKAALHHVGQLDSFPACAKASLAEAGNFT